MAALLLATPALLVAYREGPLPAKTGGFGEETCRQCHFDNPIDDPAGSLRLEDVPEAAAPGQEYPLTVVVRRDGLARAGFEVAVRYADGPHAGEQAGDLRVSDDRTRVIAALDSPVQYIQHTRLGSLPAASGEGRWTVFWKAPATATGRVVIHIAANAANGDDSPLGDFIYTTAQTTRVKTD